MRRQHELLAGAVGVGLFATSILMFLYLQCSWFPRNITCANPNNENIALVFFFVACTGILLISYYVLGVRYTPRFRTQWDYPPGTSDEPPTDCAKTVFGLVATSVAGVPGAGFEPAIPGEVSAPLRISHPSLDYELRPLRACPAQ